MFLLDGLYLRGGAIRVFEIDAYMATSDMIAIRAKLEDAVIEGVRAGVQGQFKNDRGGFSGRPPGAHLARGVVYITYTYLVFTGEYEVGEEEEEMEKEETEKEEEENEEEEDSSKEEEEEEEKEEEEEEEEEEEDFGDNPDLLE